MEMLKKTILQIVTTGTTITCGTIIIPDLDAVYHFKFGLMQHPQDIGFFDAYSEPAEPVPPIPPEPPVPTYFFVDYEYNVFIDSDGGGFLW